MTQDDLRQMDSALEQLLVCGGLEYDQQELVERCLDQGYLMLDSSEKSMVRRLLNAQSSHSKRPRAHTHASSPLQRWRQRRAQQSAELRAQGARKR